MVNKSKQKGNGFEYELINKAKELGIPAERARGSDGRALGEVKEVDLIVGGVRVQAKRRRNLPEYLKIDEGVDVVTFREDRGGTYALVRWDKMLELIKGGGWK